MKKFGSESRLGDQIATLISTTSFGYLSTEGLRNVIAAAAMSSSLNQAFANELLCNQRGSKAKAYQVRQGRAILLKEQ